MSHQTASKQRLDELNFQAISWHSMNCCLLAVCAISSTASQQLLLIQVAIIINEKKKRQEKNADQKYFLQN